MRLRAVGWRSRSFCVDTRLMFLRNTLPSEDADEAEDAVMTRSISLLARL